MTDDDLIAELKARLHEAEETLNALRNGEVDAVVVGGPDGTRVYTLENADRPYRVLIEQMQEGAVTLSDDGTILYCNQHFANLLSVSREEIIGSEIERFLAPGEHEQFKQTLIEGGAGGSAEFTIITSERNAVPVSVSLANVIVEESMPAVICGIFTDLTHSIQRSHDLAAANTRLAQEITERKRAEESLQVALDAVGMGNWDIDLATGIMQRSSRYEQIFGHSNLAPLWQLKAALEYFLAEDQDAVAEAFSAASIQGYVDFEKRIRRGDDGAVRWVHVMGRTYYREGKPIRIAGVVADVTERRLVDEQLRQAQKMEAIGQLTGGIAHDFNNLLMVIGGSLDMLGERVPKDDRALRYLAAARLGVERGAKLNQQLLAFSRRQDLHVEAVCVDQLLSTFEVLLDRAIGETVKIVIKTAPMVWFCRTDPHQLETAILNLAINARDAMPNGGTVTLSTSTLTIDEKNVVVPGTNVGEYVVVEVSDTGVGMSPELTERVFEPFFTTKGVGRGTGLGLSQVYGFARQSGGFVVLESKPGAGTTVRIHLPLTVPPVIGVEDIRPSNDNDLAGHGVVLLVEDDDDVRMVTHHLLEDLGYTVREAHSAQQALSVINSGADIDLVFSDVIMPGGMNGAQLAAELQKSHPSMPVLLCSGYTAQHLGADFTASDVKLLRKPYTASELSMAIAVVMGKLPV